MNDNIFYTLILSTAFLLLFGSAELMRYKFRVKTELTRKYVHLSTGILTMLFPILLDSHWWVLLLCGSFAIILVLSQKYDLLRSINAIDRKSVGSLAYPISVYVCYLFNEINSHEKIFFYLPILTLAICDPAAALVGKKWPMGKFKIGSQYKTLSGSAAFLIAALLMNVIANILSKGYEASIANIIVVSLVSTIAEAVTGRGYDNITIPAVVVITLQILY